MAPSKPSDCLKFLTLSKGTGDIHTGRKILIEQGKRSSYRRLPGLSDRIRRQWSRSVLLSLFSRSAQWDAGGIKRYSARPHNAGSIAWVTPKGNRRRRDFS